MATAFLIHGFLGAGKTTYARQLEAQTGAIRYSPDEWITRLYGADPPVDKFNDYVEAVFDIVDQHWPKVLQAGVDVILDFGFWKRASRDTARRRAIAVGGTVTIFHVSCSPATARQRCLTRNQNLDGSFLVTGATFDALWPRFEPLQEDEPFTLVDTEQR